MVLVFSRGVSAQCGHTDVYSCYVFCIIRGSSLRVCDCRRGQEVMNSKSSIVFNSSVEQFSVVIWFVDGVDQMKLSVFYTVELNLFSVSFTVALYCLAFFLAVTSFYLVDRFSWYIAWSLTATPS
jgi:hypothetical protein